MHSYDYTVLWDLHVTCTQFTFHYVVSTGTYKVQKYCNFPKGVPSRNLASFQSPALNNLKVPW